MSELTITRLDYQNAADQHAFLLLMDAYAHDPMGGGQPLKAEVRQQLCSFLAGFPGAFSVIARVNQTPAGLINCYTGLSTFACKPLINIHDVVVLEHYRGQGICRAMLHQVSAIASDLGACKLTLEVLANNHAAQQAYLKAGFAPYQLDPNAGSAQFWQKMLPTAQASLPA